MWLAFDLEKLAHQRVNVHLLHFLSAAVALLEGRSARHEQRPHSRHRVVIAVISFDLKWAVFCLLTHVIQGVIIFVVFNDIMYIMYCTLHT